MNLEEWIFNKHQQDKRFTKKYVASLIGVRPNYFSRVLNGHQISAKIAFEIDRITEGEVSGWNLIKNYYLEKQIQAKRKR